MRSDPFGGRVSLPTANFGLVSGARPTKRGSLPHSSGVWASSS
jgi:hypothetical protein